MDKILEFRKLNDLNHAETMEHIIKCFEEAASENKKLLEYIELLERQLEIQDRAIVNLQNENLQLQLDKAELEIELEIDEEDEFEFISEENLEEINEEMLVDTLDTLVDTLDTLIFLNIPLPDYRNK